jgi:uncharacterized protein (TIGR03435 family)
MPERRVKESLERSVLLYAFRSPALVAAFVGIAVQGSPGGANAMQSHPKQSVAAIAPALPTFEVASVRPSGPNQMEVGGFYTYPGGRIVARGCTLEYLVMLAFDVQSFQVSGGPGWMKDARFDIQAKPPDSSPSSRSNPSSPKSAPSQEQRQMLQSLLVDRFQLKFHRSFKESSVYILSRGEKQLNLQPAKDKNAFPWAGGIAGGWFEGGIRGENISMPQLAARLSGFLGRPVLDQTGLPGSFDFEYRTGNDDNDADIAGFLLNSMKGIGLKLESGKGPVETIVVDHIEQPSEN